MLVKQAKMAGEPIPDRIKNHRPLRPDLRIFMDAYFSLDSERQLGMSVGMIPWSAIHYYAQANDITGEIYEDLLYFIPRMDMEYVSNKAR